MLEHALEPSRSLRYSSGQPGGQHRPPPWLRVRRTGTSGRSLDESTYRTQSVRQYMVLKPVLVCCAAVLISAASLAAATSELADAAMNRNKAAVRSLLLKKVDVNAAQTDGTTALHWAVRADDLETADLLLRAGANVSAANREGVMPMQLAATNGSAAMIERLIKAGADPNASLSKFHDTALMFAARTGKADAIKVLVDNGSQV